MTFTVAILLIIIKPIWAIIIIIIFDVLWLIRIIYILSYVIIAFIRFRKANKVNWIEKCQKEEYQDRFDKIKHLIVIPTFQDDFEVVKNTFDYLAKVTVPLKSLFVVLAIEERSGEQGRSIAEQIKKRYSSTFGKLLVTYHPADLPGEIAGKGSNITWAGRKAQEIIDQEGISYQDVIVTSLDVDSCVHSQYFACLSYHFLISPNPTRNSYQPIPLFTNNVWEAPFFTRVVANSTTFWLLSETARSERMFTFSSHSMSFQALVDVDFWQNDIVTEDSRIYLQCLVYYEGEYSITPIYLPISMDTVQGRGLRQTIEHQYKQIRRWAYGIENFPFMIWNFKNTRITKRVRLRYLWNQLEGEYSWSTAPILIYLLGYLPLWFTPELERSTTIFQNAPHTLQILLTISMIGLLVSAVLSIIILPVKNKGILKVSSMALQWLIFPITTIAFGSIPAIDAQTRLMLGKYLGFWPTKKIRTKQPANPDASQ